KGRVVTGAAEAQTAERVRANNTVRNILVFMKYHLAVIIAPPMMFIIVGCWDSGKLALSCASLKRGGITG
ncbi:MAG: hypothetical protein IJG37_10530, partial [Synergistaceae bacterium]|nr:hypothetical protein [Synergistaceae bacterium]